MGRHETAADLTRGKLSGTLVDPATAIATDPDLVDYRGEPRDRGAAAVPSWLALVAGLWLVAAPFVLGYGGTARWNDVVVGAVVAATGLARAAAPRSRPWLSVLGAALGAWLIVAPFALGYSGTAPEAVGNDVIMGIVIVALSGTAALLTFLTRARQRR